ncbi:MBL fold metallo-hydrolase [Candidatus Dojkabacteria bacterium]|uniref:MBL fold metallo-hydrolase n=1 Tax=Candidatus Dojkabacteria bacterium TaxID=2099670 RepID=A0A955ICB2_9BACT|nr:MBL fold metallo-hydrolase [Candidatus Dojkabacteria bacterium]
MKKDIKVKLSVILSIAFFVVMLIYSSFIYRNSLGVLDIYILDVGQGDSMLIKTPNNYWALIDGGRDESALNQISNILPMLSNHISFIISTHPDLDHYGGIDNILETYKVDYLFLEEDQHESDDYDILNQIILDQNITEAELNQENDFDFDGMTFNIIWPTPIDHKELKTIYEKNDRSISVELIYKNFNIVNMGDLSKEFELEAIKDLNLSDVDLIKISHHGSKTATSSELLSSIQPKAALISVGRNNTYGHPAKETTDTINQFHLPIYRTDTSGTIHIQTDGINFLKIRSDTQDWIEYNL